MITPEGLELRLRELKVWTKFQKNFYKYQNNKLCGSCGQKFKESINDWFKSCIEDHSSYSRIIAGGFPFNWEESPENFPFWNKIADKIDEGK